MSGSETCPKCHGLNMVGFRRRYVPARAAIPARSILLIFKVAAEPAVTEHMEASCLRCGYTFTEAIR